MSRILQPIHIDHPQKIIEIIADSIDEIQKGAVILDTSIGNGEYGYIDLIAAAESKRGVFFFLNFSNQEIDFLRSIKCLQWYHENRNIFQKLYAGKIDFSNPLDILFMAPHFSPGIQKVLLNLNDDYITLLKYTCLQDGQEIKIILEKIADSFGQVNNAGTYQGDVESSMKIRPDRLTPFTSSQERTIDLKKFRQEIEIDISNITDLELMELLS